MREKNSSRFVLNGTKYMNENELEKHLRLLSSFKTRPSFQPCLAILKDQLCTFCVSTESHHIDLLKSPHLLNRYMMKNRHMKLSKHAVTTFKNFRLEEGAKQKFANLRKIS